MNRRHMMLALAGGALAAGTVALQHTACAQEKKRKYVLVVTHAAGFRHDSRDTAAEVVAFLGKVTHQWEVVGDATDQASLQEWMTPERLQNIDLIFFANTTGA
jgi:ABC-type sugar transport system substrate-binding protein